VEEEEEEEEVCISTVGSTQPSVLFVLSALLYFTVKATGARS
jgi:hypothetical protein